MDVIEKLNEINRLKAEIDEYFDGHLYERLVDNTDVFWTLNGEVVQKEDTRYHGKAGDIFADDVGWSDENPHENPMLKDEPYLEHCYREEVRSVVRKKDYTLVTIRTCTGDGCEDLIFDNSKEISLSRSDDG